MESKLDFVSKPHKRHPHDATMEKNQITSKNKEQLHGEHVSHCVYLTTTLQKLIFSLLTIPATRE